MKKDSGETGPYWTSCRLQVVLLSFFMFVCMSTQRTNMSVAIVCMVNHTAVGDLNRSDVTLATVAECGHNVTHGQDDDGMRDGEHLWDKRTQGLILSSFFWGYLFTQIPGGLLAKKYGPRWTYTGFQFTASVLTMLCPLATRVGWRGLLAMRFLIGFCAGVAFPCFNGLMGVWAPPHERSALVSYGMSGVHGGKFIVLPLGSLLCSFVNWDSIFYVFGGAGCLTCLWYLYVVYDSPEEHPRISEVERDYIEDSLKGQVHKLEKAHKEIPWMGIFTSPTVWLLMYTYFACMWSQTLMATNLPTYMFEVLKYDMTSNGLLSALPYISAYIAQNLAGTLADFVMTRGHLTRVSVRKIWTAIGLTGSSVFIVAAGHVDCRHAWLAVLLMIVSHFCQGFIYGGIGVAHLDVAPRFGSVVVSVINTAACFASIASPYLVGVVTSEKTQQQWQYVFYINLAVHASGAVLFTLFFRAEILPWAAVDVDDTNALVADEH